jgi:hypothetical protein
MPDIFDPKPEDESLFPQLEVGMSVVHQGMRWTVLNPSLINNKEEECALIGRGPYYWIKWEVPISDITFPEQDS